MTFHKYIKIIKYNGEFKLIDTLWWKIEIVAQLVKLKFKWSRVRFGRRKKKTWEEEYFENNKEIEEVKWIV